MFQYKLKVYICIIINSRNYYIVLSLPMMHWPWLYLSRLWKWNIKKINHDKMFIFHRDGAMGGKTGRATISSRKNNCPNYLSRKKILNSTEKIKISLYWFKIVTLCCYMKISGTPLALPSIFFWHRLWLPFINSWAKNQTLTAQPAILSRTPLPPLTFLILVISTILYSFSILER